MELMFIQFISKRLYVNVENSYVVQSRYSHS